MPEFIENGGGCPLVPRGAKGRIEITQSIEWMEDNLSDQGNGIILQAIIRPQRNFRRRRAFVTTKSELHAIAAVPSMGCRRHPKNGYSAPAAIGIPSTL